MTREELHALVTDILAIHVCPCCLDSMPDRADTILLAADQYALAAVIGAVDLTQEKA